MACDQTVAGGEQVRGRLVLRDDAAALVDQDHRERQPVAQRLISPALRLERGEAGLQTKGAGQVRCEAVEQVEFAQLERTLSPRALDGDGGDAIRVRYEHLGTDVTHIARQQVILIELASRHLAFGREVVVDDLGASMQPSGVSVPWVNPGVMGNVLVVARPNVAYQMQRLNRGRPENEQKGIGSPAVVRDAPESLWP
jgi:hypothetical protein